MDNISIIMSAIESALHGMDASALEAIRHLGKKAGDVLLDQQLSKEDQAKYRRQARLHYASNHEGELEIDEDAMVSSGEEPGAYVQAWVWVEAEDAGVEFEPDEDSAESLVDWLKANEVDSTHLDGLVHDLASKKASSINNGDLESQVSYLVKKLGPATKATLQMEMGIQKVGETANG